MRKSMFLVYSVRLSKKCSSSKLMSLSSFLLGEGLFVDMAYIYIYIYFSSNYQTTKRYIQGFFCFCFWGFFFFTFLMVIVF
jgi:hypothetical protein